MMTSKKTKVTWIYVHSFVLITVLSMHFGLSFHTTFLNIEVKDMTSHQILVKCIPWVWNIVTFYCGCDDHFKKGCKLILLCSLLSLFVILVVYFLVFCSFVKFSLAHLLFTRIFWNKSSTIFLSSWFFTVYPK